ncbi:MAG TPA: hypothetical protein VGE01_00335 [Fimbriimonas sp.]
MVLDPGWTPFCYPPNNDNPLSDDWNVYYRQTDLFGVFLGISGTTAFGPQCWPPNGGNVEHQGRIGFSIGVTGSIQDDQLGQPIDNQLRLNYGMPLAMGAVWGYAMFVDEEGAKTAFGDNAMENSWVGASNRYFYADTTNDNVKIRLRVDLIGDAARLQWTLQGTDAETRQWSHWFGQWVTMLSRQGPANAAFINVPGRRPLRTDQRFVRSDNPSLFPETVSFGMTQELAYGLQIINGPNEMTSDDTGLNSDQSVVEELAIGKAGFLLGGPFTNDMAMPDAIVPDTFIGGNTAYIQKFRTATIPPASAPANSVQPQWVSYYKSTTGVSNYALPYTAVVDTPKLIQLNPNNPNQFLPNPSTFRVYVDNVGGFAEIDEEIPLEGVKVTLTLPNGMFEYNPNNPNPLNPPTPNRTIVRYIDRVDAKQVGHVDFRVGTSENTFGTLTYQVKIEPGSAIKSKTIRGTIPVATQPKLLIRGTESGLSGANLVSPPWLFQNTNWETILSQPNDPMRLDQDFRAITWDPFNQQYIPQTGPERLKGTWIISKKDLGIAQLRGGPQQPTDMDTGAPLLTLRQGWNLIGNPYPYSFPVRQIVGVAGTIGDRSSTFQELVDAGVINGSLAWWDTDTQTYRFVNVEDRLIPNRGYWIYVASSEDVLLSFPPVYEPFLIDVDSNSAGVWVQGDKQWRLQLSARTVENVDDQNFVGLVKNQKDLRRHRMTDPPVAPIKGAVNVSVKETVEGKPSRLASAFTDKVGKQTWTIEVFSKEAGQVTVTWPNLSTLPKNLKARIVDSATNASRDMRRSSGYTFTTNEAETTREFKVQIEPGVVSTTKIGSVQVTREGRSKNGSVSVNYTLTGSATTTVRILGADGREIYVPARGRAEGAGAHSVVWNLRDAANRAVAPGNYRVEILAETESGERVRKLVPVVVVR